MVAGNRGSSRGFPPAAPLEHRHGGRLSSMTGELSIHGMGDDYTVEGNGTIKSLPAMPVGITVVLRILGTPTFTNSTKLICQNSADYAASAGDLVIARSDGDGVWRLFVQSAGGYKSILGTQIFTATGTYVRSTGVTFIIVEIVGAGGGGGGAVAGNGTTTVSAGGGGGGGGYCRKEISSPGSGLTVTIGAAGTAGSSGADGGTGGTSSFDTSGSNYRATGGVGGTHTAANTVGSSAGGAGGGGISGDINISGNAGGFSNFNAAAFCLSGAGGMSGLGYGGGAPNATANGAAGGSFGGGGGGGAGGLSTTATGGAGGAGLVLVHEYK